MTKKSCDTFVVHESSRIVEALVGLKNVQVLAYQRAGPDVELLIEQVEVTRFCPSCGAQAQIKDRPVVRYVDLPVFGTPMTLAWRKHRLRCPHERCHRRSWTLGDHRIAAKNCRLTTRCAKWATEQVGRGRAVSDVARELGCDWHTINDALTTYGEALLEADTKRLTLTTAIGLDETSFVKLGTQRWRQYVTTVADVANHQILEILPTRDFKDVAHWVHSQPGSWKGKIGFGALDMSNVYAAVYSVTLPKAHQVVDAFHCVQLANRALDEVRRRVQREHTGHRGRRNDPLYRVRRVLLTGEERLNETAQQRLTSLLELGDPHGEVAIAYRVKERLREFYRCTDINTAQAMLTELIEHCQRPAMPVELHKLGRTLQKWFDKICNFHLARTSNGPTEALNNLIKRIKRIGYGFRNFRNYRVRALLYAGKPNWRVLGSIIVR
ncbi:ISL3 family transposase [Actinobacteria bacterium YIM 96077]|uniref:ISL3 family transposase n=1 Tax=Phytoactinopolyspora halophila TaxID=1981511 RepID=A0A329Q9T0_9ACTN|nr:ISL3 family transposase [Phytoactinopolyspora halophila]AYY11805.1 ISL3 family transposase [Actinobacteria bacterium YIM 96077]AYY11843.1 ISL3 family transposase [Actinobacteria bacterium YIM 96077]AYY12245.1 ISL3 family transposase [Actinobacteria bacterium YIM 96077]AYY12248.1 ISL3 family transposase [Actinobacteria bacterium YIM 96077]AYY12887.1 ISL3 family transposase [Actinobacteria bacterium YIM 96077]